MIHNPRPLPTGAGADAGACGQPDEPSGDMTKDSELPENRRLAGVVVCRFLPRPDVAPGRIGTTIPANRQ